MFENWGKSSKEIELEQLIQQYENEYQQSVLAAGGRGEGDLSKKALADQMRARLKGAKQETAQYLFKQAEGPAMSMTGVSHGGAFPAGYADVSMFNPKAMPGSLSEKEEEERKRLKTLSMVAPGLMDPYLMG